MLLKINNRKLIEVLLHFISELKILEGKMAMYKRGYHILLRQLKRKSSEMKILKKEVSRLEKIVQLHEDLTFMF